MTYSTEAEVRALLGNMKTQVAQATILSAIAGADAQIDRMTSKTWASNDIGYAEIQKASRYLAAAESMINIMNTEPTQQRLWDQAMLIIQNITKFDTSAATGDFVSMSEPTTYPLNQSGIIYASSRFPKLRKTNTDNEQISDGFYWTSGQP